MTYERRCSSPALVLLERDQAATSTRFTPLAGRYRRGMDLDQLSSSLGPLQEAMKKGDTQRASAMLVGSAGGGAVQVTLKGDLTVSKVVIAPAAAASCATDPSLLEDLVAAATNDALRQYRTRFGASPEEQMQKLFAGGGMASMLDPLMASLGAARK